MIAIVLTFHKRFIIMKKELGATAQKGKMQEVIEHAKEIAEQWSDTTISHVLESQLSTLDNLIKSKQISAVADQLKAIRTTCSFIDKELNG